MSLRRVGRGVLELGTHHELLAAGGRYAELFKSWAGGLGDDAVAG